MTLPKIIFTVPNLITTIRIILIPIFLLLLLSPSPSHNLLAALVFAFSGLTDFLDGYIARTFKQTSSSGEILDPLADKLTMISAFLALYFKAVIPIWIVIIILFRELSILILGFVIIIRKQTFIEPSRWGKYTTLILYITVIAYILDLPYTYPLVLIAVAMALLSAIGYLMGGIKVFKDWSKI